MLNKHEACVFLRNKNFGCLILSSLNKANSKEPCSVRLS